MTEIKNGFTPLGGLNRPFGVEGVFPTGHLTLGQYLVLQINITRLERKIISSANPVIV